jgi:hypothetical protein
VHIAQRIQEHLAELREPAEEVPLFWAPHGWSQESDWLRVRDTEHLAVQISTACRSDTNVCFASSACGEAKRTANVIGLVEVADRVAIAAGQRPATGEPGVVPPWNHGAVTRLIAPVVLLTALVLSACSGAEKFASDAASEAASEGGCSVARAAVGEVRRQVDGIASQIQADPKTARRELTAVREALAAAETRLAGETGKQMARARAAIDDLRAEARAVADGASVDNRALRAAQKEYDDAVEQLTGLC